MPGAGGTLRLAVSVRGVVLILLLPLYSITNCALATADRNQADEFADVPSGAAANPSAVSHPASWGPAFPGRARAR